MKKGAIDTGEKVDPFVSEEDIHRYGELFHRLVQEPGWAAFIKLIERRRQNLGMASLDDSPKMHKYWRGRRDEIDELLTEVIGLAGEAAALESVEPEVEQAFLGRRMHAVNPMDDGAEEEPDPLLEEG